MPANDHTKSILSYKEILKSYEDEYWDTDPNKRSKVIDKIAKKISDEARDEGAKIDGENLKSVHCVVTLWHYWRFVYPNSKLQTSTQTTDSTQRTMRVHLFGWVSYGTLVWSSTTPSMTRLKRRWINLGHWIPMKGSNNGPLRSLRFANPWMMLRWPGMVLLRKSGTKRALLKTSKGSKAVLTRAVYWSLSNKYADRQKRRPENMWCHFWTTWKSTLGYMPQSSWHTQIRRTQ